VLGGVVFDKESSFIFSDIYIYLMLSLSVTNSLINGTGSFRAAKTTVHDCMLCTLSRYIFFTCILILSLIVFKVFAVFKGYI
jgi:hypothetical protein